MALVRTAWAFLTLLLICGHDPVAVVTCAETSVIPIVNSIQHPYSHVLAAPPSFANYAATPSSTISLEAALPSLADISRDISSHRLIRIRTLKAHGWAQYDAQFGLFFVRV
ncbi:hypothetical protein BDV97DRAFT_361639 [Delphinella strobiligena]|nr:hypothetical protein BDV97DRAFT_361639 [Delphinella strobiligena]